MKKIDLGQTIGIFANIGVIAGIIFLAVELQQNNQLLRSEAEYHLFENMTATASDLIRDASLAEIFVKTNNNEELSDVERVRIDWLYERAYLSFAWEYSQYENGLVDSVPVDIYREIITGNDISIARWRDMAGVFAEISPSFA